jgi:hypothetical protein
MFHRSRRWLGLVGAGLMSWLLVLGQPGLAQNQSDPAELLPPIASELLDFPQTAFENFPDILCTTQLKHQYNQQALVPLECELDTLVPAEQLLLVGNLASFGLTEASLQTIAAANGFDLNDIKVDRLQRFYDLVTPAKLLDAERFNLQDIGQTLEKMPLVRDALIEHVTKQYQLGNNEPFQRLSMLLGDRAVWSIESLGQEWILSGIDQLNLEQVVAQVPNFGSFSLGQLSPTTLGNYTIANGIPGLINTPIGAIADVESLKLSDFQSIGLPKLSIAQLPRPIALLEGVTFGRFDLPLSGDERDLGRQISGGIPNGDGELRKRNCPETCTVAEVTSALDPSYSGSTWAESSHQVPDGFGLVCNFWPGGCHGPAGNHPFGSNVRVLLNHIDARSGTAQVAISFPLCYDVWFVGRTCTPAVFPVPSGIPLYTIREGGWLPFVIPKNYGEG